MSQWGFYFDQSRCVGCKTCMLACKNWNELRRGDKNINKLIIANYTVEAGEQEKGEVYINPKTGENNYDEYRKFYMTEDWRRVDTYDKGSTTLNQDGTFNSTFDRKYISIGCNHCEEPACLEACPMNAIVKDAKTGVVLVSNNLCITCGKCKEACPWEAPQFYDKDYAKYPVDDPLVPRMTKCTLCIERTEIGLKPACVAACWNRALDADEISVLKQRYPNHDTVLDDFTDLSTKPNIIFKKK